MTIQSLKDTSRFLQCIFRCTDNCQKGVHWNRRFKTRRMSLLSAHLDMVGPSRGFEVTGRREPIFARCNYRCTDNCTTSQNSMKRVPLEPPFQDASNETHMAIIGAPKNVNVNYRCTDNCHGNYRFEPKNVTVNFRCTEKCQCQFSVHRKLPCQKSARDQLSP